MITDKDKRNAYMREWSRKHKPAIKARDAAYYSRHSEQIKANVKTWCDKNKETVKASNALYRALHKEQIRVYQAVYRSEHHEQSAEYNRIYGKAYRATYPEMGALRTARRRARIRELPDTLTQPQWNAIKRAYAHRCAYCGAKSMKLTKDHVIPLVQGGGTTPDNIVPACLSCNARKGIHPPSDTPALRLLL